MAAITFKAIVKIRGINPFVAVNAQQAAMLKPGWRKPLPVVFRLNDQQESATQTNMMPAGGGGYYLYLNGDVRKAAGVDVGDQVQVTVEFDAAYRTGPQHPMPSWFRQALNAHPDALKNWNALIPSRKKSVLRYFARLQSSEARTRNLARALDVLSGKKARFMARTWINGS